MNYSEIIENKIHLSKESAAEQLANWHASGKNIVFTNGCFDLIHKGHIHYLMQAAQLGDVFVIGLNSDSSVSRLKGPKRPIIEQDGRALALAAMFFVDLVIVFEEDTPLELIQKVKPKYLVKGGDYSRENIVGAEFVESIGGKVVTIPFIEGFSTSNIVEKIKNT
jgi:rfaE bifunctional protein nucleotidyltransferase chain/domain